MTNLLLEKKHQQFADLEDRQEDYLYPSKVARDVRQLSSGTLASLFDETNYDRLEVLRLKFIAWVDGCERDFNTWVEAWEAYRLDTFVRHLNGCTVPNLSTADRATVKSALESGKICWGKQGRWIVLGEKS